MTLHSELAQLLFPHITKTPDDVYRQYPPRDLPQGARVTRFAPSPTGFVHIGSLLTALVENRVAHRSGGVYFLRIEDTDKKREQDRSVEEIVQTLINFELAPDEGVVAVDPLVEVGDYGPYTQSARIELYEIFAKGLVERGRRIPVSALRKNSPTSASSRRRSTSSRATMASGRSGVTPPSKRSRRASTRASAR